MNDEEYDNDGSISSRNNKQHHDYRQQLQQQYWTSRSAWFCAVGLNESFFLEDDTVYHVHCPPCPLSTSLSSRLNIFVFIDWFTLITRFSTFWLEFLMWKTASIRSTDVVCYFIETCRYGHNSSLSFPWINPNTNTHNNGDSTEMAYEWRQNYNIPFYGKVNGDFCVSFNLRKMCKILFRLPRFKSITTLHFHAIMRWSINHFRLIAVFFSFCFIASNVRIKRYFFSHGSLPSLEFDANASILIVLFLLFVFFLCQFCWQSTLLILSHCHVSSACTNK